MDTPDKITVTQLVVYAALQRNYLYKFLVDDVHMAKSYSEAKRKIKEGAFRLDGVKYTNPWAYYVKSPWYCGVIDIEYNKMRELEKAVDEDFECSGH